MMLPRPHKREALHTYNRRLAKSQIPTGGKKIKYAKNLIWRITGRSNCTIVLDLEGPCKGPLQKVMDLGVKEASLAIKRSKIAETPEERAYLRQSAGRILKRLNELPREYEIRRLLIRLKTARKRQHEEMSKEMILEARLIELHILKELLALHAGQKSEIIDQLARGTIAA